jgi:hypothetical protein
VTKNVTGSKIAKIAARILDNPASSAVAKTVAASALTQSKAAGERTSAKIASEASRILQDERFSDDAKTLAASVLSQRKKWQSQPALCVVLSASHSLLIFKLSPPPRE